MKYPLTHLLLGYVAVVLCSDADSAYSKDLASARVITGCMPAVGANLATTVSKESPHAPGRVGYGLHMFPVPVECAPFADRLEIHGATRFQTLRTDSPSTACSCGDWPVVLR